MCIASAFLLHLDLTDAADYQWVTYLPKVENASKIERR
jgi:hypothetical protein